MLLVALQGYTLMVSVRILMMWSVPLEPPRGLLPLVDPFVQLFGSGTVPTKDLFFSGHTSTLFLLFLTARGRWLRLAFLLCTITVAVAVLLQHVHYSIDVFVAPFVAYGCYRVASRMQIPVRLRILETGHAHAKDVHGPAETVHAKS
jgi:membrane-associated phospholipid phosphatase